MDTYRGHVRTPADAIILFEACRLGLLPRVQRRLSEKERQSIKSGSVFVWDEREAGMRRWTDGKSWSASRVSGSFLTYREMEGKRGGNGFSAAAAAVAAATAASTPLSRAGKTPESTRGSDSEMDAPPPDDSPDGYRYKPDGLMKQSFSITTSTSNHLHLISYYSRTHPSSQSLPQPSSDPALRHIRPQKGMYPESTVQDQQSIPAVTRSPMVSGPLAQMPQMAGYARPSQAYPPGPPPPLPQATPPHTWPSPPPSQYPPSYAPYPPAYVPPPPHFFRHSTPPADTLPRPHPSAHHRSTSSSSTSYPQYLRAPSPLSNSTTPHSSHASPAPPSRHHSLSPTPPLAKIDPRLIDPSTTPVPFVFPAPFAHASAPHTRSPSPAPASTTSVRSRGTTDTSSVSMPTAVPASTSTSMTTIPGIGALMQEHASREASGSPRPSEAATLLLVGAGGSAAGTGSVTGEGPRDIPSEKLGFGEDMRALRVLDRAFKT